jgi:hypothetical protein
VAFQDADFGWDLATTSMKQIPWFVPIFLSTMEAGGLTFLVWSHEGEARLSPIQLLQGKGWLTCAFLGRCLARLLSTEDEVPILYDIARPKNISIAEVLCSSPPNLSWPRDLIDPKLAAWNELFTRIANLTL